MDTLGWGWKAEPAGEVRPTPWPGQWAVLLPRTGDLSHHPAGWLGKCGAHAPGPVGPGSVPHGDTPGTPMPPTSCHRHRGPGWPPLGPPQPTLGIAPCLRPERPSQNLLGPGPGQRGAPPGVDAWAPRLSLRSDLPGARFHLCVFLATAWDEFFTLLSQGPHEPVHTPPCVTN